MLAVLIVVKHGHTGLRVKAEELIRIEGADGLAVDDSCTIEIIVDGKVLVSARGHFIGSP